MIFPAIAEAANERRRKVSLLDHYGQLLNPITFQYLSVCRSRFTFIVRVMLGSSSMTRMRLVFMVWFCLLVESGW